MFFYRLKFLVAFFFLLRHWLFLLDARTMTSLIRNLPLRLLLICSMTKPCMR